MKICFHSHFYANCHEFDEGQSKQQICYSFILLISIYLKWRLVTILPNFDGPNAFFPNSTGPGPNFRMVGKSLGKTFIISSCLLNCVFKDSSEVFTVFQKTLNTWHKWNSTNKGHDKWTSGTVCGQDPL